jgi:hypothetical protein
MVTPTDPRLALFVWYLVACLTVGGLVGLAWSACRWARSAYGALLDVIGETGNDNDPGGTWR